MTHSAAQSSPESAAHEQLTVSLPLLIIEARRQMHAASQDNEAVTTWRRVVRWLENKLPAGVAVDDLDDPMLSPEANARVRAATNPPGAGETGTPRSTGGPWQTAAGSAVAGGN